MTVSACGGEEDDGVTYDDDVQVLFSNRCTTCHHAGSPINVDIQNPFNPETGLVNSNNTWAEEWPEDYATLPSGQYTRNVVPGDPDNSFLMAKLTGELDVIPRDHGGAAMPLQIPRLTEAEVGVLETWITNGAQNDDYFTANVRPIFGAEEDGLFFNGKCVFCHYEGSSSPNLNLEDPFGPNGLVDVPTTYRGASVRVVPGNPDESFLMLKVRATAPDSVVGAPMPYSYALLTERQIDTVRQWIVEGARP
jgi:hypothetical protein